MKKLLLILIIMIISITPVLSVNEYVHLKIDNTTSQDGNDDATFSWSSASYTSGKIGSAANLDTGTRYLLSANLAEDDDKLDENNNHTFMYWLKPSSTSNGLVSWSFGGGSGTSYSVDTASGAHKIYDSTGYAGTVATSWSGTWKHISLVHREDLNIWVVYVDGVNTVNVSSASWVTAAGKEESLRLGTNRVGTGGLPEVMDDFRIYNFSLSSDQINLIYNGGSGTQESLETLDAPSSILIINSPLNNSLTNDNTPSFNYTITDGSGLNSTCELFINGSSYGINSSIISGYNDKITANNTINDGVYNIYINCTNTANSTITSGVYILTIDTSAIIINSFTPNNKSVYFSVDEVTAYVTATDAESDTLYYEFNIIPSYYFTSNNWTVSGSYWVQGHNDTTMNSVGHTGTGTAYAKRDIIFNTNTIYMKLEHEEETTQGRFNIKINETTIYSSTDVKTYDVFGLDVSGYNDGNNYSIKFETEYISGAGVNRNITWWMPQFYNGASDVGSPTHTYSFIRQNTTSNNYTYTETLLDYRGHPYYINVNVSDANGESVQSNDRYITFIEYDNCGIDGNFTTNIFKLRDEVDEDLINGTVDTSITLTDNNASNSDSKTYGFELLNNKTYYMCLKPANVRVQANDFISYKPDNTDYSNTRTYYFSNTLFNTISPEIFNLYSLNDTLSSTIITTVKEGGSLIEGAIVKLLRYDVSNVTSKTVQICETGASGSCSLFAELNTQLYQFIVIRNGVEVLTTNPAQITSTTLTLNLPTSLTDPSSIFRSINGVSYTLSYDNNGTFTCVFSDDDNTEITVSLTAEKIDSRAITTISTDSVTSTAGTLTASVPVVNGTTYKAQCEATFNDGSTAVLDNLIITIPFGQSIFGSSGWIIFIFITIVLSFVFIYNISASLILNALNIIFSKWVGIINLEWTSIIGMASLFIIVAIFTRTDQ